MDTVNDFYDAWRFLNDHRIFDYHGSHFDRCLQIEVIKVNPDTKKEEKDASYNIETRIWFECGPYLRPEELRAEERAHFPHGAPSIDTDLLCGGATFEEAIVALAQLVQEKYGS